MISLIELKKVSFYINKETTIIHELNLNIKAKEFISIIGHNGSGKSSLLKILNGEIIPTKGEVLINQMPIKKLSLKQKAQDFLTFTQATDDRLFLDLTLKENIILWESRFPQVNRLTIEEIINNPLGVKFANRLNNKASNLSGGEKQVFLLMLALIHPPKILFLDEHTSALDYRVENNIMNITAQEILNHEITTIMVTHNLEHALQYANRIIVLNYGRIVLDQIKPFNISLADLKSLI